MAKSPKGLPFLPPADQYPDISPSSQGNRTKPRHDAAISQNLNTPDTKYKGHNTAKSLPSCRLPHPIVERKQNVD